MKRNKLLTFLYLALFLAGLHFLFLYKVTLLLSNESYWWLDAYVVLTGLFLLSRFFIVYFYSDDHSRSRRKDDYPTVSFVIAGKNEEDSIYRTIETCMDADYPNLFECIAVDDGSTDRTYEEMKRAKRDFGRRSWGVKVISFPENRGKREGMTAGVLAARGEIVIFVDSDSFLERQAARLIVEHFVDSPKVGAVSGNTGVENVDTNALTRMQAARYGVSFDVFKACESVFGAVTCCPGCFSAYRRAAVLEVLEEWRTRKFLGTVSTFGDDRGLTNCILRKWDVVYCREARATTIVPDTYGKFLKQQVRWKKSWIREGVTPAKFIWRRNILASSSFYTNLLIPIFSPFIALNALFIQPVFYDRMPVFFLAGLFSLSLLLGFFNFIQTQSRYWIYVVIFSVFYVFVHLWQMPYALFKLKNTTWGTR